MTITNNNLRSVNAYPDASVYYIHWKMTEWCNYRCSYCSMFGKGKVADPDMNLILHTADGIKDMMLREQILDKFDSVKLNLIGGEVGFIDIPLVLSRIGLRFSDVQVITNLSAPYSSWKSLIDGCAERGQKLSVSASYHEEFADWNEFLDKCRIFGSGIKVLFVLTESNFSEMKKCADDCDRLGIHYFMHIKYSGKAVDSGLASLYDRFRERQKPSQIEVRLTDGTRQVFRNRDDMLLSCEGGTLDAHGLLCDIICRNIDIRPDGKIKMSRCLSEPESSLDSYHLPEKPAVCASSSCIYCSRPAVFRAGSAVN